MRFEEALKAMREGKKVKRKKWTTECLCIVDGALNGYSFIEHQYNTFPLSLSNIMSEDWEIVDKKQ